MNEDTIKRAIGDLYNAIEACNNSIAIVSDRRYYLTQAFISINAASTQLQGINDE